MPSIFLIGPMGAGKSSIGRGLAEVLQCHFYDSDHEIEARCGASLAWVYDIEGPDGFLLREEKVIDDLSKRPNIVLATGGGAISSAKNRAHLAGRGTVVYLHASLEQQRTRTGRNLDKRPQLQVDDIDSELAELHKIRHPLYEDIADITISTDNHSVRAVIEQLARRIEDL